MSDYRSPYAPRPRSPRVGLIVVLALVLGGVVGGVAGGTAGYVTGRSASAPARSPSPTPSPTSPSPTTTLDPVAAVAQKVLPSTVEIITTLPEGTISGTGFVLDEKGNIATNNHVVATAASTPGARLEIRTENGLFTTASVVGRSPSYDLAVINAAGLRAPVVTFGNSDDTTVGQAVVAIGAPLQLAGTVTSGIVSAKDRPVLTEEGSTVSYINAIQTDAAINPGNSGGPLVDLQGKVIGVDSANKTTGSTSGAQQGSIGLGFAIPINDAKRVIDQLLTEHRATFPVLGVTPDLDYDRSARVQSVSPGSPAAKAGLQPGDVVQKIGTTTVLSPENLIVLVRSQKPGSAVTLTVQRDGKTYPVQVRLAEAAG